MYTIVTAAGTLASDDPLFIKTGITQKALLPLAGKPMVQWVIDALLSAQDIDGIIVVGLPLNSLVSDSKPLHYALERGNMVDNLLSGLREMETLERHYQEVLVCSSDVPLIQASMVDNFIAACHQLEGDAYYAIVSETTLEAQFPQAGRTYAPLKGGRYSGGDLFLVKRDASLKVNYSLLRKIIANRKNVLAQARLFGYGFTLRLLLRSMDVDEAVRRASQGLNIQGRVIDFPQAEVAMDVDKLQQYEMVKQLLEDV